MVLMQSGYSLEVSLEFHLEFSGRQLMGCQIPWQHKLFISPSLLWIALTLFVPSSGCFLWLLLHLVALSLTPSLCSEEASMMDNRSPLTYCVIYHTTVSIPLTGPSPYVTVGSCTAPMHQKEMFEYEALYFLSHSSSQVSRHEVPPCLSVQLFI